jgi:serine/threonine-protein kinase OSR1/STK39
MPGAMGEMSDSMSDAASASAHGQQQQHRYPTDAGAYDLIEEIGHGVSATVWRAECKGTGETVAIKVLDLEEHEPEHLDEIRREAQTMSMLSHPNLVKYHCSFVNGAALWVVMPYLAGGSALNLMKWSHPSGFEETVVACIVKAALKALDYFHRNGNIHRDVKAGNILVDENGQVKLADFGVSASCWGSGGRPRSHQTFVGTPCWMAPEVMEQEHGYDFHADIWSLGITILELCHGHAPFSKYPPMKVLLMTLQNPAPTLEERVEDGRHFSRALREFVTLCLQKDPSKRPSASKLLEHKFLKEAKKADWLAKTLLENIPSLGERTRMLAEREARRRAESSNAVGEEQMEKASNEAYKHGVSNWNFDVEDLKAQAAAMDDPADAAAAATAAANAMENMNISDKVVEKKGRFEIINEDVPEQSQTSQTVQRRGRFDIIEESNQRSSRSTSPTRASSPAPGGVRAKKPIQKGRFTVHSDGDGVDLRDFSDALHAASTLHNTLRDLYAQAQDQTNIIANLEDENARLKARIADLERAAAAPK